MEKLKQNQRVHFEIDGIIGDGKIIGISHSEMLFIGFQYIIEPDTPINNEIYPYSHFSVFQNQLTII